MMNIQAITEEQARHTKVVQFEVKPKLAKLVLPGKIASILNIQSAELAFLMSKETFEQVRGEVSYFEQYSSKTQILLATLKQAIKQYSKNRTDNLFHIMLRIEARLDIPETLYRRVTDMAMQCQRQDIVQFIQMKYREDQGKFIRIFYNVDAEDLVKLLTILFPFDEVDKFLTHVNRKHIQITNPTDYKLFWNTIEHSNESMVDMFIEQDIRDCHIVNLNDILQLLTVEMIEQLEYTTIFDYWLEEVPKIGNQLVKECSEQKQLGGIDSTIEDNYSSNDSEFEAFRFIKRNKKNGGGQLPN